MSGKILIGLGLAGAGWVFLHRQAKACASADMPVEKADQSSDVGECQNKISTITELGVAVGEKTMGTGDLGGSNPQGTICNNATPVLKWGPCGEGGVSVDHMAPDGGTDPSKTPTHNTVTDPCVDVGTETPGIIGGKYPPVYRGDMASIYEETRYGVSGASGLTKRQAADAYMEIANLTGGVY
jgi:hypothetical protein